MSTNTDHLSSATSKAIRKIIPMVVLMFILAYLDRSNIGFAKQEFQLTTGLSDAAYAFGAGIFLSATHYLKCQVIFCCTALALGYGYHALWSHGG